MKVAEILICFLLSGCVVKNQPASQFSSPDYFILHDAIRILELDPLGNIYIVDESERISKFDTTGLLMYNVVNNQLGEIHSIDVGNPFKILAFYRDQQNLVIFDNTLSEIQRIPLIEWDLHDVTAANLSPDNAIWIFNGENKVLMKMNDKGDAITTSDPFDILEPPSSRPDFIYDADQFLLLKEAGKPIAVFDDFGKYVRALHDVGEQFTFYNHDIVYPHDKGIRIYDITDKSLPLDLPLSSMLPDHKVYYTPGTMYMYDEKGIIVIPK